MDTNYMYTVWYTYVRTVFTIYQYLLLLSKYLPEEQKLYLAT